MDFRAVVGAFVIPGVDLPEEVDEPSCLVGDFSGDLGRSAKKKKDLRNLSKTTYPQS